MKNIKNHKAGIFFIAAWLIIGVASAATTVKMKSGKEFSGEIIEKTDEGIKIRSNEATWKIPFSMIDRSQVNSLQQLANTAAVPTQKEIPASNVEIVAAMSEAEYRTFMETHAPDIEKMFPNSTAICHYAVIRRLDFVPRTPTGPQLNLGMKVLAFPGIYRADDIARLEIKSVVGIQGQEFFASGLNTVKKNLKFDTIEKNEEFYRELIPVTLTVDATEEEIAQIYGDFVINLPTGIRRITLDDSLVNVHIRQPTLTIILAQKTARSFNIAVWGKPDQILSILAYSSTGSELKPKSINRTAQQGIVQWSATFDEDVTTIKVTTAEGLIEKRYPFNLMFN